MVVISMVMQYIPQKSLKKAEVSHLVLLGVRELGEASL
jgi:hypothetical protein